MQLLTHGLCCRCRCAFGPEVGGLDADAAFDGGVVQNIDGDRWIPIQTIDHLLLCLPCVHEMALLADQSGAEVLAEARREIDHLRMANAELRVYAEHLEDTLALKPKRPPGRPRKVRKDNEVLDPDIEEVVR